MKQFYLTSFIILSLNCLVLAQVAIEPTLSASNINFSNITNTSVNINWTNGDGARRLVLAIEKNSFNPFFFPRDGSGYIANSTFKLGSNLGYQTYVVYDGTGSNVTVNGLFNGTPYNFTVLEYNGSGSTANYKVSNFPVGNVWTTGPVEPTIAASNLIFSNITNTTANLSWTSGNGSRRLVLAVEKTNIEPFFFPKDGISCTANSTFKLGTNVGYRMYVVYDGTGNSVNIDGLFNGTQYNFAVIEYNGSGGETNYMHSPYLSSGIMTTGPTEPTIRTSNITFSNRTPNSMRVNWTNGNGENRIVLVRASNTTDTYFSPQDGRVYNPNPIFGQGEFIGWVDASDKRHFVAYNGSGNNFTLNGLEPNTEYYFAIFEYNGSGVTSNYKVDIFPQNPNPSSRTLASEPTLNASNLVFSDIGSNSMNVSWTNGNGSQRVVVASTNPFNTTNFPRDGGSYNGHSIYGSGSNLGGGTFVIYRGSGSSTTINGLSSGTNYYFAVVEFNGTGNSTNYLTSGYLSGNEFTLGIRTPTQNATNLMFSNILNNSFQVNWTSGNGQRRLVIISTNSLNNFHFPRDGQDYTANSVFGGGSNVGNNTFVVYNGTESNVIVTGLLSGTTYYVGVVEYNGSGIETRFLSSGFLNGSQLTTGATKPTVNATSLIFSNVSNSSIQVDWTNGNGARRLVIISSNALNNFHFPQHGQEYSANSAFGSGSNLGNNTYAVYNGTGSGVNITGLSSGTTYYIGVVEFNGVNAETNYLFTGFLNGSQLTTGTAKPTINATNLILSSVTNTGFHASWTNGNGERRLVIVSPNSLNDFFFARDGQEYTANSIYGSGSNLGNNTFVVYKGTGSSVSISGLTSGTTYHVGVVEFNGIDSETKYLYTGLLRGSQLTTGIQRPTVNATNLLFSNVSNSNIDASWTNGNGSRRLVIASVNALNTFFFPKDGQEYLANSNFGSGGSNLGNNTFVVYNGTGSNVSISGLSPGTIYYIGVVEYNGTGIETKYLSSGFLRSSQNTSASNLRLASSSDTDNTDAIALDTSEIDELTTGLQNLFQVYPNPTSENVTLSLNLDNGVSHVTIYSLQGSLLFVNKYHGSFIENIDLKRFSKGVYIIRLNNDSNLNLTKRLVIN